MRGDSQYHQHAGDAIGTQTITLATRNAKHPRSVSDTKGMTSEQ
jgi:hypothetical protein